MDYKIRRLMPFDAAKLAEFYLEEKIRNQDATLKQLRKRLKDEIVFGAYFGEGPDRNIFVVSRIYHEYAGMYPSWTIVVHGMNKYGFTHVPNEVIKANIKAAFDFGIRSLYHAKNARSRTNYYDDMYETYGFHEVEDERSPSLRKWITSKANLSGEFK